MEIQSGIAITRNQEILYQMGLVIGQVLKGVGKVALAIAIVLVAAVFMSVKIATSISGNKG